MTASAETRTSAHPAPRALADILRGERERDIKRYKHSRIVKRIADNIV